MRLAEIYTRFWRMDTCDQKQRPHLQHIRLTPQRKLRLTESAVSGILSGCAVMSQRSTFQLCPMSISQVPGQSSGAASPIQIQHFNPYCLAPLAPDVVPF
jgi:hypothetical protein